MSSEPNHVDSNQPARLQGLARRLIYCSKLTQQTIVGSPAKLHWRFAGGPIAHGMGGGGVVLSFLTSYVGSGPVFSFHPIRNIRNFKQPKFFFEIYQPPKISPNLYLNLKKRP